MNTRINHAHMRVRTCIDTDQNENGYVPGQRATMRYQEGGLVQNKEHKHSSHVTKSSTKSHHMSQFIQIDFYFKENYLMLGPHQSPFIFALINFANSIT